MDCVMVFTFLMPNIPGSAWTAITISGSNSLEDDLCPLHMFHNDINPCLHDCRIIAGLCITHAQNPQVFVDSLLLCSSVMSSSNIISDLHFTPNANIHLQKIGPVLCLLWMISSVHAETPSEHLHLSRFWCVQAQLWFLEHVYCILCDIFFSPMLSRIFSTLFMLFMQAT